MPVSRNPFSWLSTIFFGLVLIPFTILIYPFVLILLWLGFINYSRKGNYAEILDTGIKVTTQKGDTLSQYEWGTIEEVEMEFEPPSFYPALRLSSGEKIHLHCANFQEIVGACKERGIKINKNAIISST